MSQPLCQIEHHAVLYALLARGAVLLGKAGEKAIEKATIEYGLERGRRMARYAEQENITPCAETYSIFKEWRPPREGQMTAGPSDEDPSYVTRVSRCEWVNSWKKHRILEYGRLYCVHIDRSLYQGYQSERGLTVRSLLSAGDQACTFDWGFPKNEGTEKTVSRMREQIQDRYVKDFTFHTADLLRVVSRVLIQELGQEGGTACEQAWAQFRELFGAEYSAAILDRARQEGWELPFLGAEALD